jgi:hypothetical protein
MSLLQIIRTVADEAMKGNLMTALVILRVDASKLAYYPRLARRTSKLFLRKLARKYSYALA